MIPITANASFDLEGGITPEFYIRDGIKIPVDGISKKWEDQDGVHFIAMIPGDQIVELLFSTKKRRWYCKTVFNPFS